MTRFSSRAVPTVAVACLLSPLASATPLTAEEVAALCAQVGDPVECGQRVEARQLARFPGIAVRDGDTLRIDTPGGARSFIDREARSHAMWGYFAPIDGVLLYTVSGDTLGFTLLLRASGAEAVLANEPVLSPDGARLVTADFCRKACDNEIAVWRVEGGAIRKERIFRPRTEWTDVTVRWRGPETLAIERTTAATVVPETFDFRLSDRGWVRIDGR